MHMGKLTLLGFIVATLACAQARAQGVGKIVPPDKSASHEVPGRVLGETLLAVQATRAECEKMPRSGIATADCWRKVEDLKTKSADGFDRLSARQAEIAKGMTAYKTAITQGLEPGRAARKEISDAVSEAKQAAGDLKAIADGAKSASQGSPDDDSDLQESWVEWQEAEKEAALIESMARSVFADQRHTEAEIRVVEGRIRRAGAKSTIYHALADESRSQLKLLEAKARFVELGDGNGEDIPFVPPPKAPPRELTPEQKKLFDAWKGTSSNDGPKVAGTK